ncbi:MAG TPA: pilus assembly protein TadG-related protein, partial [Tepidisphaeraceae bacterium]|nr:pilus assembly protein TadG-related protein [Tepidisphaeraceae bacterium]
MNTNRLTVRSRRGTVLVYTTIAMVAFAGFISLAVDVGHVRMVRNQLQDAADAAARYAVAGMQTGGPTQARSNAVSIAAKNYADGTPVVLDPNNDIQFGTWDPVAKTFTPLSGAAQTGANAVQITCQRSAARGNAVALAFASIVGKSTSDAQATSTATINTTVQGFVGINGISLQSFNIVASYDSSSNSPDRSMSWKGGEIASNGPINILDNCFVLGNIVLGPSGSLTKGLWFLLTGQQQTLPSPMYYAPASAGDAAANNNNAQIPLSAQGIDVTRGNSGKFWLNNPGDSITIPGGTYYFQTFKTQGNN